MGQRKLTRKSFFKSVGALVLAGFAFPWLKKSGQSSVVEDLPLVVEKDPKAVQRSSNQL